MEKVFKNKKLAYVLIGILLALQLTQSIANWVGGGFNGGSLILCILMLGLLTLVGVGIFKKNMLLTLVSSISILSVIIYVLVDQFSGKIQQWIDGKVQINGLIAGIFSSLGALMLIISLILVILKVLNINKNFKKINAIISLIAMISFLTTIVIVLSTFASDPQFTVCSKINSYARDFFALFSALLVGCVGYQLEFKE